jgi:hypothetical protein
MSFRFGSSSRPTAGAFAFGGGAAGAFAFGGGAAAAKPLAAASPAAAAAPARRLPLAADPPPVFGTATFGFGQRPLWRSAAPHLPAAAAAPTTHQPTPPPLHTFTSKRATGPLESWCDTCGKHKSHHSGTAQERSAHRQTRDTPRDIASLPNPPSSLSPPNPSVSVAAAVLVHEFKAKRSSGPLSRWCRKCGQHADAHGSTTTLRRDGTSVKEEEAEPMMTCQICAETKRATSIRTVSCCGQQLCSLCVERITITKQTTASEILALYLSAPFGGNHSHQCPECGTGPIEHFRCSDLTESTFNRCPSCSFSASTIQSWPPWNGKLPPSLLPEVWDCPFCRKTAPAQKVGSSRPFKFTALW